MFVHFLLQVRPHQGLQEPVVFPSPLPAIHDRFLPPFRLPSISQDTPAGPPMASAELLLFHCLLTLNHGLQLKQQRRYQRTAMNHRLAPGPGAQMEPFVMFYSPAPQPGRNKWPWGCPCQLMGLFWQHRWESNSGSEQERACVHASHTQSVWKSPACLLAHTDTHLKQLWLKEIQLTGSRTPWTESFKYPCCLCWWQV